MKQEQFYRARLYFVVAITIAFMLLVVWDYFHGGLSDNYVMGERWHGDEIPHAVDALFLPFLLWFLTMRIGTRLFSGDEKNSAVSIRPTISGFVSALIYAIAISISFSFSYTIMIWMMLVILAFAIFLPVYRAEYILGFVIGMSYTFGVIQPAIVAGIFAIPAAGIYLLVRL